MISNLFANGFTVDGSARQITVSFYLLYIANNVARNKTCVRDLTSELMDLQMNLKQHVEKMNSQQQTCTANSLSWMSGLRENYGTLRVWQDFCD